MNKEIIIQAPKAVLILYENEIYQAIKPEYLEKALKRGKGFLRAKRVEQYEKSKNVL